MTLGGFELLLIASFAVCAGCMTWFFTDETPADELEQTGFIARSMPVQEISITTGLAAGSVIAMVAGGLAVTFFVLSILQGPTFAFWSCLALLVIFSLSGPALRGGNIRRKLTTFEDQLPTVIDQLITNMRGGRTLKLGVEELPRQLPEPAAEELQEVAQNSSLGPGLAFALETAARKYNSRNYRLMLAILTIFLRQGGNIVEPLSKMSVAFKGVIKADRKIRSATTQGRSIFFFINFSLLGVFAYLSLILPSLLTQIFESAASIICFVVGLLIYCVGGFWLWQMMSVEA